MTLDTLIKLIRSFGPEAEPQRQLLTECLESLFDLKTRNSLKAYVDELESR